MDDDVVDDIEEMSLVVHVSCVDWMMRWIECMSRELHLTTLKHMQVRSSFDHLYIIRED
jgi:hypothetical protein